MEKLMSLQQYVRQVKPRNESYIPPVDKVQRFFVEASLSKAQLENALPHIEGSAYEYFSRLHEMCGSIIEEAEIA